MPIWKNMKTYRKKLQLRKVKNMSTDNMNAEDVIVYLIDLLTDYLDELDTYEQNDFTLGEKTAYVETLEILQSWKDAKSHGLDYRIEDKYKI